MSIQSAISETTKAILLDHNGTLINSEHAFFEIWQALLARYVTHLTAEFYFDVMAGLPVAQNAIDVVKTFSLSVSAQKLA